MQRDREAAALISEDDTDLEVSELEERPQLSLGGFSFFVGTPTAPSIDSPISAEQRDGDVQLEAGCWEQDGNHWVLGEELQLNAVGTMMLEEALTVIPAD